MIVYVTPFYLDLVAHMPRSRMGAALLTSQASLAVTSIVAGELSRRFSYVALMVVGVSLVGIGAASMLWTSGGFSTVVVVLGITVVGIGIGFFRAPNAAILLRGAPRKLRAFGAALAELARQVAFVLGINVVSLLMDKGPGSGASSGVATRFDQVAMVAGVFAAAALVWARPKPVSESLGTLEMGTAAAPLGSRSILVHNLPRMSDWLNEVRARSGFRIYETTDGQELLMGARSLESKDAVLTLMYLEDEQGLSLIKQLGLAHPGGTIIVHGPTSWGDRARTAGAHGYYDERSEGALIERVISEIALRAHRRVGVRGSARLTIGEIAILARALDVSVG
jgi:MFS family permease